MEQQHEQTPQPPLSAGPLADLSAASEQVFAEVRRALNAANAGRTNSTEGFWDNLQGFLHAVDWQVCCAALLAVGCRTA
jgi:hypothetical protein